MENSSFARNALLILTACLAWFALIAQFVLNINSGVAPLPEIIIRYFSYFTLLSNLLVAFCCTSLLRNPKKGGGFFTRPTTVAATTVYIVIVGIVYNTLLRGLLKLEGLNGVLNEILHVVNPLLFFLYWLLFAPKGSLRWKNAFPWMLFPFIYGVCVLGRGSFAGWYPYPFMNLDKLGRNQALLNVVWFTLGFLGAGLLFVWLGKLMSRSRN